MNIETTELPAAAVYVNGKTKHKTPYVATIGIRFNPGYEQLPKRMQRIANAEDRTRNIEILKAIERYCDEQEKAKGLPPFPPVPPRPNLRFGKRTAQQIAWRIEARKKTEAARAQRKIERKAERAKSREQRKAEKAFQSVLNAAHPAMAMGKNGH